MSSAEEEVVRVEGAASQDVEASSSPTSLSEGARRIVAKSEEAILQKITVPSATPQGSDAGIDLYAYESAKGAMPVPAWYTAMRPNKEMNSRLAYLMWLLVWKVYGGLRLYRFKPRNGNPQDLKVRKNKHLHMPYYLGNKRKAIAACMYYIRAVRVQLIATVAVVSRKGGVFKTGLVLWLSSMFAMASNNTCGAVDLDSTSNKAMLQRGGKPEYYNNKVVNPGYDASHRNYDMNVVIDLVIKTGWRPTSREVCDLFPRHVQSGVYMVSPSSPTYTTEGETALVLDAMTAAFQTAFVDTTPGEKEVNTVTVIKKCGHLLLIDEDNIEGWNRINLFRTGTNESDNGSFDKGLAAGTHFVVIGQVPIERYNMRYRYALANHLNVDASQLILIPEDIYIKEIKTVDFDGPGTHFMFAMWMFACQIANRIVAYNETHPQPKPGFDEVDALNVPDEITQKAAADTLIRAHGSLTGAKRYLSEVNEANKVHAG